MANTFSRTMRSLEADRTRGSIWPLLIVMVLLAGWGTWFLGAKIAVYEVSSSARLEVVRSVHTIQTPIAGRVAAHDLKLGRRVNAGDPLLEIDAATQRLNLQEEQSRRDAYAAQLVRVDEEIAREESALTASRQASKAALAELRARHQQAKAAAEFSEKKSQHIQELREKESATELEYLSATSEARQNAAAEEAARLAIERQEKDSRTKDRERAARLESRRAEKKRLEGALATTEITIERLKHEIAAHVIRAPVLGELGEVADLQAGTILTVGEQLGAIIPEGELKLVAGLPPDALGRVQVGQAARVRFHGFPWTQYGSTRATVTNVATEPTDGLIRVELAAHKNELSAIPYRHGLPGDVEIEVERTSPAMLVLRAAGKLLSAKPDRSQQDQAADPKTPSAARSAP
ncbi:MAG: HlyD family secretion protein [Phycisphaerales bacterium]|nr:HlyD family secretion protein [Phycisphaerales bacterium]